LVEFLPIYISPQLCLMQNVIIIAALWNRAGHYIFMLWFLSIFYLFFSSANLSGRRLDVYHTHGGHFAALNRGRHLYSAERPSRWALTHILLISILYTASVYHSSCTAALHNLLPLSIFVKCLAIQVCFRFSRLWLGVLLGFVQQAFFTCEML